MFAKGHSQPVHELVLSNWKKDKMIFAVGDI